MSDATRRAGSVERAEVDDAEAPVSPDDPRLQRNGCCTGLERDRRPERDSAERRRLWRRDRPGQVRARSIGVVPSPASQLRDDLRRQPEDRDAADSRCTAAARPESQDRRRTRATGERRVAGERCRVEHRDERPEVFADDEVERDGERGLVGLGSDERRTISLGEQGESEGKGQERHGHGSGAGTASERYRGEPDADPPIEESPRQPNERAEEPGRDNGCRERDQPRQEQENEARSLIAGEPGLVGRASEERDDDDRERNDGGTIEEPEAGVVTRGHRGRGGDDDGGQHHHPSHQREPGAAQHTLSEDRPRRRPGSGSGESAGREADE